jgi:hypothetical protein
MKIRESFPSQRNLVEKVTAKKIDLISPRHELFGCGCFVKEGLNQELNVN